MNRIGLTPVTNLFPVFPVCSAFLCALFCGLSTPMPVEAWTPIPGITISPPGSNSEEQQIGMDAAGNATAVWTDFTQNQIGFATLLRGARAWSSPGTISPFLNGSDPQPKIAVTPSGYSIVVWSEFNGTNAIMKSSTRSVFGGPWSTPLTIAGSSSIGVLEEVSQVAVDANGNAVAIWQIFNGTNFVIQAATLLFNASSWTNLTNLTTSVTSAINPQIALDASGNGVAVWGQIIPNEIIQSRTYSGGIWLGTTHTLSSPGAISNPSLSINPSGVAVAAWEEVNGPNHVMNASRFIGGVWSAPADISTPGSFPGSLAGTPPGVAVDIFGNALVLWRQSESGVGFIESAYLPIGSDVWTLSIIASDPSPSNVSEPTVAFDAQGNATAAWASDLVIQAAQLPFGIYRWVNQTNLSTASEKSMFPQIAIDPSGYAVVDWLNFSIVPNMIQATTNPALPLPPSNFIGVIQKNRYLNKTECILQATWGASISNVSSYLIYQNGAIVGTVLATALFSFRLCLQDCSAEGYEIAAMGLDNLVSDRIPLKMIHEKSEKPCRKTR